jgi:putative transposase
MREAFKYVSKNHPFAIDAFVMLPDHIHCVWTLPDGDSDFSIRWGLIKGYFTKRCNEKYKSSRNESRVKRSEQAVWQRRFWEHQIRDDDDFAKHVDYIHYNPVKHGYVNSPHEWEYSSFHRHVKEGLYNINWGAGDEIRFGNKIGNE